MKIRSTVLAAVFAVATASALAVAQDQSPPSTEAAATHRMPAGPGVDMTQLCARVDMHGHYYPEHARDRNIEGQAILECALDSNNRIETCWQLSETPPDENFGRSAMYLACRVRPRSAQDMSRAFRVEGDARMHMQVPMNFRLFGAQ